MDYYLTLFKAKFDVTVGYKTNKMKLIGLLVLVVRSIPLLPIPMFFKTPTYYTY
jgi:hypothetical protein